MLARVAGGRCGRAVRGALWALFWAYLVASVAALVAALLALLRSCLRRPPTSSGRPTETHAVPEWAFRQPDPLIYSQYWLQSHGLAYTWQNPDISLELQSAPGQPVDAHSLAPDTDYRVLARVWNGSTDAPVAQLPVEVSYIDFGIGGASVPIATTTVDLPVKGAPGTPAVAGVAWRTPATPGHYCLQVRLVWPYDADPGNNLGQHNVDVKPLNSPRAEFRVPVRNNRRRAVEVRLELDTYELPALRPCPPPVKGEGGDDTEDRLARRRRVMAEHGAGRHPVPEGWRVDLGRAAEPLRLEPGESEEVVVVVTAPDGFVGRQAFNVKGMAGTTLIGGVTLVATGDGDG